MAKAKTRSHLSRKISTLGLRDNAPTTRRISSFRLQAPRSAMTHTDDQIFAKSSSLDRYGDGISQFVGAFGGNAGVKRGHGAT